MRARLVRGPAQTRSCLWQSQAGPPGPRAFPLHPTSQLGSIREQFHFETGGNAELKCYTHIEPERHLGATLNGVTLGKTLNVSKSEFLHDSAKKKYY